MKNKNLVIIYILVIIVCIIAFFPIYWMFTSSLQSFDVLFDSPPTLYPVENIITSYLTFLKTSEVPRWILNSFIVSLTSTLFATILGVFGAYSISRFKYRGKHFFMFLILLTQLLPGALLVIPIYIYFAQLKLIDTLLSLIIIYTAITAPISIWFLKGFFDSISTDLEDAALIDGCSRFATLIKVVLPLVLPGILATATYCFIVSYNEYVFAYTMIQSVNLWTASIGVGSFVGEYAIRWDQIMTASIFVTIPVVFLFMFFQRYIVGGLTAGSIKE
jgi:ABC-type glycerol-3-phosphate transport system permease component